MHHDAGPTQAQPDPGYPWTYRHSDRGIYDGEPGHAHVSGYSGGTDHHGHLITGAGVAGPAFPLGSADARGTVIERGPFAGTSISHIPGTGRYGTPLPCPYCTRTDEHAHAFGPRPGDYPRR